MAQTKDHLAYLIAAVNKQLEDELEERLRTVGITIDQMRVLEALGRGGGLPMGMLATRALVEPTTLTKLIDRMVADGLVQRLLDTEDRRRVLITLLPAGEIALRRLNRIAASQEAQLKKRVSEPRLAELRSLLWDLTEG